MNDRVSKEKMPRQRQPKICGRTIDAIEHFEVDKEKVEPCHQIKGCT